MALICGFIKLLNIEKYHRNSKNAKEYVFALCSALNVQNFKTKLATGKLAHFKTTDGVSSINLRKEIQSARETGVPNALQKFHDQHDRLMPPSIDLAMWTDVPGLLQAELKVTVGSFSANTPVPGILQSPISTLSDDILHYREETVKSAQSHDILGLARNYRAYLQACISLPDAFLGQATFALKEAHPKIELEEEFQVVRSPASFKDRLDAWCKLYRYEPSDFWRSKSWSDMEKLRNKRNEFVHPAFPAHAINVKEVADILNRCRDGVGGTLAEMRNMMKMDSKMSYIQKVKTAPKVTFIKN